MIRSAKKVFAIVNYDNFSIEPGLVDDYTEMVKYLPDHYYLGATRYTTTRSCASSWMMHLRAARWRRTFLRAQEARGHLRDLQAKAEK